MSIKSKAFAVAATMTMVGGVSAVGLMSAQASTPSCNGSGFGPLSNCVTTYGDEYGQSFVLDVYKQGEQVGTHVILYRASNSDPAEDFTYAAQGLVSTFVTDQLASPAFGINYGPDQAFELEYSPYGVESGLCVGVASTATNGTPVALETCGASSKTLWVWANGKNSALINGSDTNFSHPYVLNYPGYSYPTDEPRPQLTTWTLSKYSGGAVYDNQLWNQNSFS